MNSWDRSLEDVDFSLLGTKTPLLTLVGQYSLVTVSNVVDHFAQGEEALRSAQWAEARDCLRAVHRRVADSRGDGWLGAGVVVDGRDRGSARHPRPAYSAYRKAGRLDEAARVAIWLGLEHAASPGHEAIAGGWLSRAERLLDGSSSSESGWLSLARSWPRDRSGADG